MRCDARIVRDNFSSVLVCFAFIVDFFDAMTGKSADSDRDPGALVE